MALIAKARCCVTYTGLPTDFGKAIQRVHIRDIGEPTSGLEPLTCSLRARGSIAEGTAADASLLLMFSTILLCGRHPPLERHETLAEDS
jgi:hypothetical protein